MGNEGSCVKAYVITIKDNEKSVEAAKRCIESGKKWGADIEMWTATTPQDAPRGIAKRKGFAVEGFEEVYSRFDNCLAAFCSHYSLWEQCLKLKQPITIFEHDAVVTDQIPERPFKGVMNIGAPSYGKFNEPQHFGVGPLTTKRYFPGAHAYQITPAGANELISNAKMGKARPTDVYINLDIFPWLQEFYPFIAKADDSFTTIQRERGCLAKHNYSDDYKIEKVT